MCVLPRLDIGRRCPQHGRIGCRVRQAIASVMRGRLRRGRTPSVHQTASRHDGRACHRGRSGSPSHVGRSPAAAYPVPGASRPAASQRSSQASPAAAVDAVAAAVPRRSAGNSGRPCRHSAASGRAPPARRTCRQAGQSARPAPPGTPAARLRPSTARLPAMTDCSQSSQGSVKSRGRPTRTKSPRAGSLP